MGRAGHRPGDHAEHRRAHHRGAPDRRRARPRRCLRGRERPHIHGRRRPFQAEGGELPELGGAEFRAPGPGFLGPVPGEQHQGEYPGAVATRHECRTSPCSAGSSACNPLPLSATSTPRPHTPRPPTSSPSAPKAAARPVSGVPPPCGRTLGGGTSGFAISYSPSGTIQLHLPRPIPRPTAPHHVEPRLSAAVGPSPAAVGRCGRCRRRSVRSPSAGAWGRRRRYPAFPRRRSAGPGDVG